MEKILMSCHSLQEVRQKFSLQELFTFARKKILSEWLEVNFYFSSSKKIAAAVEENIDDAELKLILCNIFNLDFNKLNPDELDEISKLVAKNQRKNLFMKYDYPDKKSAYVENQGELVKALRDGAEIFYLYGAEFSIPVEVENKIYIGCNNAIIDFTHDSDVDLDALNIILEDLQIYLRHPITLKMEKSKNVKILNGAKKTLGIRPTLQEIFEIMRGRSAFESAANFFKRAEGIRGVAVGETLFEDKNYNYDAATFAFQPQWNFEFVNVLKDFAQNRNFYLNLAPNFAEQIYTNERKLQIFADFTYIDGKLTILNLYFDSQTLGRLEIESVLREVAKKIFGSNGRGYGLHIITAYQN